MLLIFVLLSDFCKPQSQEMFPRRYCFSSRFLLFSCLLLLLLAFVFLKSNDTNQLKNTEWIKESLSAITDTAKNQAQSFWKVAS